MSAMKETFMDAQEKMYTKLESFGAPREVIYDLEDKFVGKIFPLMEFGDFAAQMAGYAAEIIWLSEMTGYTEEKLWDIWQELVQAFADGEGVHDTLQEEWESFKQTTNERDW